jgi:DNA polymerase
MGNDDLIKKALLFMDSQKKISYAKLVYARKVCKACQNITNPSEVYLNERCLDSGEIGPWSQWQNSLDAKILLVGQDWGSVEGFIEQEGEEWDNSETNRNLIKLLGSIGFHIKGPTFDEKNNDIFFTNAVLCLKDGGAQAKTDEIWFRKCGKLFLRPLIELIEPKIVIALGKEAYKAIIWAYMRPIPSHDKYSEIVDKLGETQLNSKSRLFAVYHPSRRIINTHRPMDKQLKDWEKIKNYLNGRINY